MYAMWHAPHRQQEKNMQVKGSNDHLEKISLLKGFVTQLLICAVVQSPDITHLQKTYPKSQTTLHPPLEFQRGMNFTPSPQSYSSLHSGCSLAWDHVRGDIDDPCGAIADFCPVIADPCGVVAIPEAIGGRRCGDADRCAAR